MLEVAGVGNDGRIYWSDLDFENGDLFRATTKSTDSVDRYLAVCIVRHGCLAAVTPTAIHWLARTTRHLSVQATTAASIPDAIACFPHHPTNELIVVGGAGKCGTRAIPEVSQGISFHFQFSVINVVGFWG